MKEEKGITMVSLAIYIVVMTLTIAVMGSIITNFYKNTDTIQGEVKEIIEFNKFNIYFLKEIKMDNNRIDSVSYSEPKAGEKAGEEVSEELYILFTSGNAFSIKDGKIYYNNIKICENLKKVQISFGKNGNKLDRTIINVTLNFKTFNKSISYKMENIY